MRRHPYLAALTIAIISSLAAAFAIPVYNFVKLHLHPPQIQATISSPIPSTKEYDNLFGANGFAQNIPSNMELWLVVKSGVEDKYYPLEPLVIDNDGGWNIPNAKICPALGSQVIQVYLVPKAEEGSLSTYSLDGTNHLAGIPSMPTGSVREAQSRVTVLALNPEGIKPSCP